MGAPDKIYLAWEYSEIDTLPPGVTARQVFSRDVCYIRKDKIREMVMYARNMSQTPDAAIRNWDSLIQEIDEL